MKIGDKIELVNLTATYHVVVTEINSVGIRGNFYCPPLYNKNHGKGFFPFKEIKSIRLSKNCS